MPHSCQHGLRQQPTNMRLIWRNSHGDKVGLSRGNSSIAAAQKSPGSVCRGQSQPEPGWESEHQPSMVVLLAVPIVDAKIKPTDADSGEPFPRCWGGSGAGEKFPCPPYQSV